MRRAAAATVRLAIPHGFSSFSGASARMSGHPSHGVAPPVTAHGGGSAIPSTAAGMHTGATPYVRLEGEGGSSAMASLMATIDTFLLDCDGVLWRGGVAVPGAADAIAALKRAGKRVVYLTNNSTKSRREYVSVLAGFGIAAEVEEVVGSAFAAAAAARARGVRRKVYVLGGAGLVEELEGAGLTVLGPSDADASFEFGSMRLDDLDPEVEAVVAGFDATVSYAKLARACSYLRYRPDCAFVATNRDATFPDTHMVIPGGGIIIAAIETGSGRRPDIVAGKPNPGLIDLIVDGDGRRLDPGHTAMVGDRLDTDIAFGAEAGLAARILVTATGVHTEADIPALHPGAVPPSASPPPLPTTNSDNQDGGGGSDAWKRVPTHTLSSIARLVVV